MASTYPIGFGPTFNPLYEIESGFFFDDFVAYSADSTNADVTPWADVSSTGTEAASAAVPWGAVALACGAQVTDDAGIELNGEPFSFDHTKDMLFGVRFQVSALGSSIYMGLHTEAFDVQSGSLEQDHIGFGTQGDANLDFTFGNSSGQTVTDTTQDLVASTWYIAVWKFTAADQKFRFYVDGDLKGTVEFPQANAPTSTTQMTLGLHNESMGTDLNLLVDWVYLGGER